MRKLDIQIARNFWLSLGIHIDHTDPSVTLHLPGVIIMFGRCVQPGLPDQWWSLREKQAKAYSVQRYMDEVVSGLDDRAAAALQAEAEYWAVIDDE
jgi:hypothetical protein